MSRPSLTAGEDRVGRGVRISLLHTMDEATAAADLWRAIWGGDQYPVQAALLVALAHAGGYVSGAWVDERLVGASMGFPGPPADRLLHSHITGVELRAAGRGLGLALKTHQAEWCRDHGIDRISWTFDPLVARNAWFNLARLGVEVDDYHVDHYGEMPDTRNQGQGSDRLLVTWHLDHPPDPPDDPTDDLPPGVSPGSGPSDSALTSGEEAGVVRALVVGERDEPVRTEVSPDAAVVAVGLPRDIEAIRDRDPDLAIRWRHAVRDVLGTRLSPQVEDPWHVTTFTSDRAYLLQRPA